MDELENAVETTTEETPVEESKVEQPKNSEYAKLKAAFDKTAKELADTKRELRKKQSAEEVAAEEAKERQLAIEEELAMLRKEKAVGNITVSAMDVVFGNNEIASQIGQYLYGAEDADAALAAIKKAWTAREKALRLEYGKIPAPAAGNADGVSITKEQLDGMKFTERVKFANEHPDEYNKLMGR